MIGCLKINEKTNRDLQSKYFTPTEIIPDKFLPSYFSGAAYFMSKLAISKILLVRETVPILHLDDVYIGRLIAKANIADQMLQSVSICTGVNVFERTVYPTTPCFMSGLTVYHRFIDSDEMVAVFNKLKTTDVSKSCGPYPNRWTKDKHQFIASEWRALFDNYRSYGYETVKT